MLSALLLLLSVADANETGWRLSAVYDMSALGHGLGDEAEDVAYAWRTPAGMEAACGPAKAPDGLRVAEAQALSAGLMPGLAILLQGEPDADALGPHNTRVVLGRESPEIPVMPFVLPRSLIVNIDGPPQTRAHQQLVRTQLEMEMCLEHKTGRGWRGHAQAQVQQAFLIREHEGSDRSRKYFGGQLEPAVPLLGPPDACFGRGPMVPAAARSDVARAYLTPTDVWGATIQDCERQQVGDRALPDPLSLVGRADTERRPAIRRWTELNVALSVEGSPELSMEERLQLQLSERVPSGAEPRLWPEPVASVPLYPKTADGGRGLVDVLASVPYFYPELKSPRGERTALLLIPEWQLVEVLRRLEGDGPPLEPTTRAPVGIMDAVGHVLGNPELLYVQVEPVNAGERWPNLAAAMQHPLAGGPFGYSVSSEGGRGEVFLAGGVPPQAAQVAQAHRSAPHAISLLGLMLSILLGGTGVFRLFDLWTKAPEERALYWPGREAPPIADTEANSPDVGGGE